MASHLAIERVVKRYPNAPAPAVAGVSLELAAGEFFALLGPSGCGKTSLLRLLAGFERPDEGRILIDGHDVAEVPPYARPTNMMFQSYALFPHMTVADNIAFGLRQDGLSRAEIAARVGAMLDLVKLTPLAGRKPRLLSGGEKQRVALARALVKEPKLLLLDEPLTALDRKLREETRFELVRIQRRVGITFLMVTHDQEEAMGMASRIAVMNEGRIVQMGAPDEVYEHPANTFVAGFLGAINLLSVRVVAGDAGLLVVESAEAGRRLSVAHGGPLTPGTAITLAVRPERIVLRPRPEPQAANALAGRVRAFAFRGGASDVEVELASGKILRATLANAARPNNAPVAVGQEITLSWAPEAGIVLER